AYGVGAHGVAPVPTRPRCVFGRHDVGVHRDLRQTLVAASATRCVVPAGLGHVGHLCRPSKRLDRQIESNSVQEGGTTIRGIKKMIIAMYSTRSALLGHRRDG